MDHRAFLEGMGSVLNLGGGPSMADDWYAAHQPDAYYLWQDAAAVVGDLAQAWNGLVVEYRLDDR